VGAQQKTETVKIWAHLIWKEYLECAVIKQVSSKPQIINSAQISFDKTRSRCRDAARWLNPRRKSIRQRKGKTVGE